MYSLINFIIYCYIYSLNSIQLQLFNWALEPAADEILDKLYEQGYQDAAIWAEQKSTELITKNEQSLTAD
jgi:hypothetical protein